MTVHRNAATHYADPGRVRVPPGTAGEPGLGLLVGDPIVDNIAALLAATAVTASLAAIAYRSMRA